MDRLFERLWANTWGHDDCKPSTERVWTPSIEVTQGEGSIVVRAELPGVDPKAVEINLDGDTLVISGEKKDARESKEKDHQYSERFYGSFRRALTLPFPVEADSATAEHTDGVLTVTLKKDPSVGPRKITLNTA